MHMALLLMPQDILRYPVGLLARAVGAELEMELEALDLRDELPLARGVVRVGTARHAARPLAHHLRSTRGRRPAPVSWQGLCLSTHPEGKGW